MSENDINSTIRVNAQPAVNAYKQAADACDDLANSADKSEDKIASLRKEMSELNKESQALSRAEKSGASFDSYYDRMSSGTSSYHKSQTSILGNLMNRYNLSPQSIVQKGIAGVQGLLQVDYRKLSTELRSLQRSSNRASNSIEGLGKSLVTSGAKTSVNDLSGSVQQLSNQLTAIAAPLTNTLAPAIGTVLDLMNTAAVKMSEFTAVIAGQGYYEQALPVQSDLANAMNKTATSTSKATKAQKEYNASVLSYDQLHKLSKPSSSSSSNVTSDVANANKYVQKAIGDGALVKFGKQVREAFNARDWRGMGNAIADFAKTGLTQLDNAIKWDNVKKKITGFNTALTDTLNTINSRKDMWQTAGTTVGDGVTTIVKSLADFDNKMQWIDLGNSIGTFLNSGIDSTDWENVGRCIVAGFQTGWDVAVGVIRELNPESLGKAIFDMINGGLDRWNPENIGETIGTTITKFSQAITKALTETDEGGETIGQKLGHKVATGFKSFFSSLDGKSVAEAFNAITTGLIDSIGEILADKELRQACEKNIADLITTINWGNIFKIIAPVLGVSFAVNFVAGFVPAFVAEIAKSKALTTAMGGLGASTAGTAAASAGTLSLGQKGLIAGGIAVGAGAMVKSSIDLVHAFQDIKANGGIGKGPMRGEVTIKSEKLKNLFKANGGGVSSGQVFVANERGPEMIGKIGNDSVVMNNNQIVDAVSKGVASAVSSVLGKFDQSNNSTPTPIILDGEQIGTLLDKARARSNVRYNPAISIN